eukprot:g15905.t1
MTVMSKFARRTAGPRQLLVSQPLLSTAPARLAPSSCPVLRAAGTGSSNKSGGRCSGCASGCSACGRQGGQLAGGQRGCSASASRSFSTSTSTTSSAGPEKMEFKAETKKLLNIVAKSLYTDNMTGPAGKWPTAGPTIDKEVFIRELISNASDACEKLRFLQASGKAPEKVVGGDEGEGQMKLKIELSCDDNLRVFTIQDYGIGMTKEQLVNNLGTIARSGSREFLEETADQTAPGMAEQNSTIIGQFGVGFYSAFVVADKIEVFTRSADAANVGYKWTSDGMGEFTVEELENYEQRGTKIVLHLKEDCAEFSKLYTVKQCAKKFSSFVDFPLFVNEEGAFKELTKQEPLWLKSKATEEEHAEFYRFLSGTSYGDPFYTLSFASDVPLTIKSLFYVPEDAPSRFFAKEPEIGDTALMNKLSLAVVRRFLRFLDQQSKKDAAKYLKFYKNYSYYLKAGLIEDRDQGGGRHKEELTKLLRFGVSTRPEGEMISLQDYVDNHLISTDNGKQKNIYYYCVPNRETAMNSPYLEQFKERGRAVLLMHDDIDEFVISSALDGFKDHKLIAIDAQDKDFELDLDEKTPEKGDGEKLELSAAQQDELKTWLKETLGQKVMEVKFTERLVSSPAVVTSMLTPHMRKMMKQMMAAGGQQATGAGSGADSVPMTLEISAKHPIMKTLFSIREQNAEVAKLSAELLFDNACIAAGMLDEPRSVLPRLNKILETMVMQGAGYDYAKKEYAGATSGAGSSGGQEGDSSSGAATSGQTATTSTKTDGEAPDEAETLTPVRTTISMYATKFI